MGRLCFFPGTSKCCWLFSCIHTVVLWREGLMKNWRNSAPMEIPASASSAWQTPHQNYQSAETTTTSLFCVLLVTRILTRPYWWAPPASLQHLQAESQLAASAWGADSALTAAASGTAPGQGDLFAAGGWIKLFFPFCFPLWPVSSAIPKKQFGIEQGPWPSAFNYQWERRGPSVKVLKGRSLLALGSFFQRSVGFWRW